MNQRSKTILLLGGSSGQLPAIEEAKSRGYNTILCDFLTDNPGQHLVDKYIPASTTDVEAILTIARGHHIDAILGYASDPAALTVALVGHELGLVANIPKSVEILTNKDKFRKLQAELGLSAPKWHVFGPEDLHSNTAPPLETPYIIKPVDSSDTKGVFVVNDPSLFGEMAAQAITFSRCKKVIAEEFIDAGTVNLHGDGFVVNGKLEFLALGELIFASAATSLKPSATWYPGDYDVKWYSMAREHIQKIIHAAGFTDGPVNIEARVNKKGEFYLMEIGPRSGGSLTPVGIQYSYGFNMIQATFDLFERKEVHISTHSPKDILVVTAHVNQSGIVEKIQQDPELAGMLLESHLEVSPGDKVQSYEQPGSSFGVYIYAVDKEMVQPHNREKLYHKIINQIRVLS